MKLDKEMEEYIKYLLRAIIYITGLYYIAYLIPVIKNPDSFLTIISEATINYFKTLSLPITITGVTIAQFNIAYNNREIARKKALIELEEKTIKEFLEIKELLEGIVSTNNNSYFQLLNNMKIKDKLIEEKILDKLEGKRFKYSTKFDNEEQEYKKQISKMYNIINRNIENTSFFLYKEKLFNLSNEEIEALKNNSKVIHDYFLLAYKEENKNKKENTQEEDIKKEITHLLNELKDVTGSHEINGIKRLLNKCTHVKGNKIMNWENVQKSAQDIINIIEKI